LGRENWQKTIAQIRPPLRDHDSAWGVWVSAIAGLPEGQNPGLPA
jgi:hypothetical protein